MVGPSKTLVGLNCGSFINSQDTIVRLNKSVPLNMALGCDIGDRTDILYHCLDTPAKSKVNVDNYIEEGIKEVVCSYPSLPYTRHNISYFKKMNKDRLPFRTTDLKTFNELEKEIGTRPNTGLLALVDILKYDIKFINIMGFDFYRHFYYEGYSPIKEENYATVAESPAHDQQKQMEYWAKLYLSDKRIIIDHVLEDIFKEEGLL